MTLYYTFCRLVKRKKSEKKVENSEEHSLPSTNSSSGTSIIYAELDFREKTSASSENRAF